MSSHPYSDIFDKQFPFYLSIGMTYDQYWNGDCTLVRSYRDADKLRLQRQNEQLWLQGRYIYDAVGRLYPLFNANVKRGTKVKPYPDKPYQIFESTEEEVEEQHKQDMSAGRKAMEMFMMRNNQKFKKGKEVSANG